MTLTQSGGSFTASCNKCGGWRNHTIVHTETTTWHEVIDEESGSSISGGDEYKMLRCLGCDSVSVQHISHFSQTDETTESRYPPASLRRKPSWMTNLFQRPRNVVDVLEEIYVAFENESYRLCGIGIRALIEDIMTQKVGEKGSLGKNVDAFIGDGFVAQHASADFKTRVIELGNASMHRGHRPTRTDIEVLLDIVENLVASIYIHPSQLKNLSPIPPRSKGT